MNDLKTNLAKHMTEQRMAALDGAENALKECKWRNRYFLKNGESYWGALTGSLPEITKRAEEYMSDHRTQIGSAKLRGVRLVFPLDGPNQVREQLGRKVFCDELSYVIQMPVLV